MDRERLFFSSLNYQTLLNISASEADRLAELHCRYVQKNDTEFYTRLLKAKEYFTPVHSDFSSWINLEGWHDAIQDIQQARLKTGSCLLALFHFGPHRDLLPDLAAHGIPVSAPIAGNVYEDFYAQRHLAPGDFADCFELLPVDDKNIGRSIFKRIRAGRCIAIYVDGNMGPDGHYAEEGSEVIHFSHLKIRAKSGIARLALKFRLPILPIFSWTLGSKKRVSTGQPISVATPEEIPNVVEQLYTQLFSKIQHAPEQWEYAACLQRWRVQEEIQLAVTQATKSEGLYRIPENGIRFFTKGKDSFLINIPRNKVIKLPEWLRTSADALSNGHIISNADIGESDIESKLLYLDALCDCQYLVFEKET